MSEKVSRIPRTIQETKAAAVKASLRWREKNKEKYNAIQGPHSIRWYNENKARANRNTMNRYYYRKEAAIFRHILLD